MKRVIKAILLILNVVVLLLLVGSTLAGRVAPSRFIWFSLLSYGYLYFLIINIVFVVLWLIMSSKWFLLSLAAIVVRYAFLPLYFQVGGTETVSDETLAEPDVLKVLTFNAHHFHGVSMEEGLTDSNMTVFLDIVDDEQPDIMALQEYIGHGDTVQLTERLKQRGYVNMTSGYDNGSMTGEVIFSKYPIARVVRIEGPSKLYVNLLWNGDTLRFYCLHLNSYGLDETDHKQIHDISHGNVDSLTVRSTLRKFRETIVAHENEWEVLKPYFDNHDRLSIVAGDFNETPASYFYHQCRPYLKDSYCEAGQGFSTTYHGSFTRSRNATFPAFRIDMVLHTTDMEAISYKRIKSEMSDHYPVIVTLRKK